VIASPGVPDDWAGNFPYRRESQRGALQAFFEDASDPDNRALVHARLSERPEIGISLKALGVEQGAASSFAGQRQTWDGIYRECALSYDAYADKIKERLTLKRRGHPTKFRSALRLAPGLSGIFAGNAALIFDAKGNEVFRILEPWGEDRNGKRIRVTMREGAPQFVDGILCKVIVLELNEDDLEGAAYPIVVDPTVQITGTTDIEDNWLRSGAFGSLNYGSRGAIFMEETGTTSRIIVRIATIGAIPLGVITALRLHFLGLSGAGLSVNAFIIKDANPWVEGTVNGATQIGSSCWSVLAFNTTPWAGQVGCGLSGTDFDADGTPPTIVVATGVFNAMTLKPEWATAWRDATRLPNGIILFSPAGAVATRSSEGSPPLFWEVDFEEILGNTFFLVGF
jgi:hypothetical protein